MTKRTIMSIVVLCVFFMTASFLSGKNQTLIQNDFKTAQQQYRQFIKAHKDSHLLPRSTFRDGSIRLANAEDWTSGFFPGCLWYLYEYTHDNYWMKQAQEYTNLLENEQYNVRDHDIGFRMYCSYGNGLRLIHDSTYVPILVQSAKSLMTRFNPVIGCTQSWNDEDWRFPVIIDNMMNLELLFFATKVTGDSSYFHAAVSHADVTLKNHFRKDFSTWHLLDYDPSTGEVIKRQTVQGNADTSAWARGQSWGLYGYTMAYRETGYPRYLVQARRIADFLLNHPNLPDDKVPLWDYNADATPDQYRDTSAGAIMASALYELSTMTGEDGKHYKEAADQILESLSSPKYLAKVGENHNFLLMHGVGNHPADREVDTPLIYGDYYFLEANLRKMKIEME